MIETGRELVILIERLVDWIVFKPQVENAARGADNGRGKSHEVADASNTDQEHAHQSWCEIGATDAMRRSQYADVDRSNSSRHRQP